MKMCDIIDIFYASEKQHGVTNHVSSDLFQKFSKNL